jgi:alpha-D-xyloside xylohydrolase
MTSVSVAASLVLLAACSKAPEGTFVQEGASVVVTPASGPERRVRLDVRTDRIVRVTSVNDGKLEVPKSLMVVDAKDTPALISAAMAGATPDQRSALEVLQARLARNPTR